MLFPDRRDFLILTPFPIRLRDLFGAKLAALGLFLLAIVVAANAFPVILLPIFSAYIKQAHAAGVLRLMCAQVVGTGAAAAFAFFAVAAFQGLLINLATPRFFRRLAPWIQMLGMSLMVLSLLLFPIYAASLRFLVETHPGWLRLFPPYWFAGVYELMLPRADPFFASLGVFGWKALGCAIAVFCITWAVGFRRHYRRTLESEDSPGGRRLDSVLSPFTGSPEETAVFRFTGQILARSTKHRLFLATYWSVGVSLGLLVLGVVRDGRLGVSPEGLRSFPLLVTFFVISGFRAAFQFPAELPANWLFRMAEAGWGAASRRAARKRVIASGLAPALLLFLPVEVVAWGWKTGLFHSVFQLGAGALLTEALFWNFDKVPFTCSYFPGATNLAVLAGLYLYGFTNYSFMAADLEASLERNPAQAVLCLAAATAALMAIWRWHRPAAPIRFEAGEPEIQTLELS
jgi:hypothetical protein